MKKELTVFTGVVLVFALLYLIGCFSEASFNIKEWDSLTRNMIAFTDVLAIMGVLVFNYSDTNI